MDNSQPKEEIKYMFISDCLLGLWFDKKKKIILHIARWVFCSESTMVGSTQRVSHVAQREEMSSTGLSELQLSSQQRREDRQQEDHPWDPETPLNTNIPKKYCLQIAHFHKDIHKKDIHFYLVRNYVNSHSFHLKLNENKNKTEEKYLKENFSPPFQNLIKIWSQYSYNKEVSNCEKCNIFNEIMMNGFNLENEITPKGEATDRNMKDFKQIYHQESRGKKGQFAFAVAYMENGERLYFPTTRPNNGESYNKCNSIKDLRHSEEILIEKIEESAHKHGQLIQSLFIFSYNSPCLNRLEENSTPCMILLLIKAIEWKEKYGFFTDVIYKEAWGLSGPNFFKDSAGVNLPCPQRNFQMEIYENENCCNDQTSREVEIRSKEELSHNLKDFIQNKLSKDKMFYQLESIEKKIINNHFNDVTLQLFKYHLKDLWKEKCPLRIHKLEEC